MARFGRWDRRSFDGVMIGSILGSLGDVAKCSLGFTYPRTHILS